MPAACFPAVTRSYCSFYHSDEWLKLMPFHANTVNLRFFAILPIRRTKNRRIGGFLPDTAFLRVWIMEYTVQRGDTIARVTESMGSDWRKLKELNPQAVGRSTLNGNWFFREGATLSDQPKTDFAATLKQAAQPKLDTRNMAQASTGSTDKIEAKDGGESTHTLKAGETVWGLATKVYHVKPEDILKLNNITDPRSLQIGRTLRIPKTQESIDKEEVVASWYGQYHHGRTMANGQPFDMYGPTIAHKDIPLGTKVLLENPETGEQAVATVTDRGPYVEGRDIDLSYKLAQRLSLEKQGVGSLIMQVL